MRPLLLLLAGCTTVTGGERVTFDAEVSPVLQPVDGVLRWEDPSTDTTITLTEARIWVGPVYLWTDEPLLQVGARRALGWLLPRAWASADHFVAGFITGEITDQVEVDLVAAAVVPFEEGRGLAGRSLSGELWLEPVAGDATLTLVGEAETPTDTVPFRLDLTFDDAWFDVPAGEDPLILRRIRGLPWDARIRRGGTLTVEVDASRFLAGADFDALRETPPVEGVHPILPGTLLGDLVRQRVRQVGGDRAWELMWQ